MPTIFSERLFLNFEEQFRPFLDQLDIPETIFTRRDVEISDVKYVDLLETVARNTNPYIGLDMGERLVAQDLGVLGHAMAATATVGEALALFSHYIYVFAQSNTIRLDLGEDKVVCSYSVTILQPDLVRQDAEFALAFMTGLIRKLSRREFHPNLVEFGHSQLAGAARHQNLFGCKVMFERRTNRVHFSKKVLDFPVLSADQGLLEALQFYLDDRLKVRSEEEDLVAKTRHLISVSLSRGVPDLDRVASLLGMSKRTLQRKLGENNIIFSDLVESISKSIAMDYVQHTDYSLTDVALMLGYSELSSFSRAFKRWNGMSPQDARRSGETPAQ
jgi:AraC-like DNA-binding protein